MTVPIDVWSRERAGDLAALCDVALPDERLTRDELDACCFDESGVVLGTADGTGAVAACVRSHGDDVHGFLHVIAVEPAGQSRGLGRRLLDASMHWARERGATTMSLGGGAPFYLWPGVDVRMTRMLSLAEVAGFFPTGAELNMGASTMYRAATPDGIVVRRVLDDADEHAVIDCCAAHWPAWVPEVRRGIEHGACLAAWHTDGAVSGVAGFACHSVNRAAWVGPIATVPAFQRRGIAAALMSEVCRDLGVAGHQAIEIAWVGPVGFYARAMGAVVTRTFRTYVRRL